MFREELQHLTERVPGAHGALIMGLDGIAVDKFTTQNGVNLEVLSAEYMSMVKKTAETNADLGIGSVAELSISTPDLLAILMAVTPEYFLIFALKPTGNSGRARYEARKSSLRLAKELS